jgi:hypothetical protein
MHMTTEASESFKHRLERWSSDKSGISLTVKALVSSNSKTYTTTSSDVDLKKLGKKLKFNLV